MNNDFGIRDNDAKDKLSLVLEAPQAIRGASRILDYGCRKYSRRNWKKGLPYLEIVDSLMRHLVAFVNGEEVDSEGLPHVDCITVNAIFLAELVRSHPNFDDRKIIVRDPDTGDVLSEDNRNQQLQKYYEEYRQKEELPVSKVKRGTSARVR